MSFRVCIHCATRLNDVVAASVIGSASSVRRASQAASAAAPTAPTTPATTSVRRVAFDTRSGPSPCPPFTQAYQP